MSMRTGSGVVAGYPLIYLQVVLVGGSVSTESSENIYMSAAADALTHGLRDTECALLEPHMRFEVTAPDEYAGGVIHDLQRRGADITEMDVAAGARVIRGHVPLSKMFGYTTTIRSITQGRGQHLLEPFEYRPLPPEELAKFR